MNKILREEMEYLIHCDDKAITPDVKDDVSLTLQCIDELEDRIDKAIEILQDYDLVENKDRVISDTFKALRGKDND